MMSGPGRESGSARAGRRRSCFFIFRPEQYGEVANDKKAEAEIIVGKNRNGPTRNVAPHGGAASSRSIRERGRGREI